MLAKKVERLVYYPAGFIIVGLFLYQQYPDTLPFFGETDVEKMYSVFFLYYFGYIYGTLSLIIKATDFHSLLLIVGVILGKLFIAQFLAPYAFILLIIEIISLFIIAIMKLKRKKELKPIEQAELAIGLNESTELSPSQKKLILDEVERILMKNKIKELQESKY